MEHDEQKQYTAQRAHPRIIDLVTSKHVKIFEVLAAVLRRGNKSGEPHVGWNSSVDNADSAVGNDDDVDPTYRHRFDAHRGDQEAVLEGEVLEVGVGARNGHERQIRDFKAAE